jgi:uncharacterized protein YyaL (SSP411 family)
MTLPAQEAFRDWPPASLVERPYWLPWSRAAFRRAALFDRPVFLLLDVNWSDSARRMVDGTLADPRVLRALNRDFVTVRVNADLRPEIRERYQTGTWPVIGFLVPTGAPMLSQVNTEGEARPITTGAVDADSLLFLLREGAEYWHKWPDLLVRKGEEWRIREAPAPPLRGPVDAEASDRMARWLLANADRSEGGFGLAPKFVVAGLAEYARSRERRGVADLGAHARLTLERLVASPLYDARAGGVHRIALAPSFGDVRHEKLLDTNAALLRECAFALEAAESAALRDALAATARFLTGVLGRAEGGFHLAQS